MAFHNSFAVYVDGINYTSKAVAPPKWGNFLDEQLDECYITLKGVKKKVFSPLTPIEIVYTQQQYYDEGGKGVVWEHAETIQYFCANDPTQETQVGSGYFTHDMYLIEVTKYAECVIVDTLTFTNDIGRNYAENATPVTPVETDS